MTEPSNPTQAAPGRVSVALAAPNARALDLRLTSPQFEAGGALAQEQLGDQEGCHGQSISPELNWSGAPAGTVSYLLTLRDPDASTDSGIWHWATYNIPASATGLAKGAGTPGQLGQPTGSVAVRNDAGQYGYLGPCPPPGDPPHRYTFTLYALNKTLDAPPDVTPAMLNTKLLDDMVLAKVSLVGLSSH